MCQRPLGAEDGVLSKLVHFALLLPGPLHIVLGRTNPLSGRAPAANATVRTKEMEARAVLHAAGLSRARRSTLAQTRACGTGTWRRAIGAVPANAHASWLRISCEGRLRHLVQAELAHGSSGWAWTQSSWGISSRRTRIAILHRAHDMHAQLVVLFALTRRAKKLLWKCLASVVAEDLVHVLGRRSLAPSVSSWRGKEGNWRLACFSKAPGLGLLIYLRLASPLPSRATENLHTMHGILHCVSIANDGWGDLKAMSSTAVDRSAVKRCWDTLRTSSKTALRVESLYPVVAAGRRAEPQTWNWGWRRLRWAC